MAKDESRRDQAARNSRGSGAVPSFLSLFARSSSYEDPAPIAEAESIGPDEAPGEDAVEPASQGVAQTDGAPASADAGGAAGDAGAAVVVERMYQQEVASARAETINQALPQVSPEDEAAPDRGTPALDTDGAPTEGDVPPAPPTSEGDGRPKKPAPAAISNPKADIAALDELERHIFAHRYALTQISCYGPSIDPANAVIDRGEAQAILESENRELLTDPETGALLDRLDNIPNLLSDTQKAQVRILRRDRDKLVNVPAEVQEDLTRLLARSGDAWHKAKARNDWASFAPYVDQIVTSLKKVAEYRDPNTNPYDLWLDYCEPGTSRAFYDGLFEQIRAVVVPLLTQIRARGWQPDNSVVTGRFDVRRQWELASDLVDLEGLDRDSLFVTSTEHPYSDALTTNYAIIAAHVFEDDLCSNIYTMLHEGGHALYECGVDPAFNYTSLKGGTSMGMHESQSRFFENYVGRSRAFSGPLLRTIARHFKGQFGRATPNQLYLAVNRVEGGPLRTEADELTYPLHIIIRYEIEQMLFSGEIDAAGVPQVWNEKYLSYLGVKVPDDTHGCLQDTHWADGLFGYFPTYALGSVIGAQLRRQMILEGMDWEGVLSSGNLAPVRAWLEDRVWRYGRSKDSSEIIEAACKAPLNVTCYTDYLLEKFGEIYNIHPAQDGPEGMA